jgi:hypothetical protein
MMPTKRKTTSSRALTAKARQVLAFAQKKAKQVADWVELHFSLFAVDGKATDLFATEAERAAFLRTAEYKQILALFKDLPSPEVKETIELVWTANGYERKPPEAKR